MRTAVRRPGRPRGQERIIAGGRLASHHDRVDAATERMDQLPRLVAGDPTAHSGMRGDLAVERHGPFGDHPRPAQCHQFPIRRIEPAGLRLEQSHFDRHAGGTQLGDTATLDLRERVRLGYDQPPDAGGQHGAGAGGRFALVAARFERHVEGGVRGPRAGNPQGLDLGMILTESPVPALADNLGPSGDHTADHRVRFDTALAPQGKLQGAAHVPKINLVLVHSLHT